jgi:hypothetical protein
MQNRCKCYFGDVVAILYFSSMQERLLQGTCQLSEWLVFIDVLFWVVGWGAMPLA